MTGTLEMGATPGRAGVTFRVWAPHARKVFVTGTFNATRKGHPGTLDSADGLPSSGTVGIGPYTVLLLSQDG